MGCRANRPSRQFMQVSRQSICRCIGIVFLTSLSTALGADNEMEVAKTEGPPVSELKKLSLEELMDVEVTSVSRSREKLSTAPAAITVITSDEIRRSGATSIPEALRLAPGVEVAQADTHT